ncbi:MAG TPA: tetratricopeptide repeat protein [Polyangiales bacterium]|jgi:TolA-binding protein|nr:tetratricopeptide repeat protein [Polyangiales bacterium]
MTKSDANQRFEEQKRDLEALQAEVRANNLALGTKLKELEDGLEKARLLLTRDSADVVAQVQGQQQKMAELEGKMDEMTHNLQGLVEQTAKAQATLDDRLKLAATAKPGEVALDPSQIPGDKAAHFSAAYDAYKASEHEKSRALFAEYLKRYPADDKAGDAQYWIGASYLVQNKPATALGEYRKVISNYAKSPAVDTALYGMADAFFRLHACTDAKGAVDALVKRKPSKALEDRAKQLSRAIKDAGKEYCTS